MNDLWLIPVVFVVAGLSMVLISTARSAYVDSLRRRRIDQS